VDAWLTVAAWVTGIGGAALLLTGVVRKLWQFNKAVVSTVELISGLPARLDRIDATLTAQDTKLAEIHHETHENNGSSIKDSVHRVENSLDRVERGVKGLYDRTSELERTQPRPPKPINPRAGRATRKKES